MRKRDGIRATAEARKRALELNQAGALSAALAVTALIAAFAFLGCWSLLRRWRHLVETQLRIDRCVGLTAQGFRDKLKDLEAKNQAIRALRAAAGPAALTPVTEAMDQAAITALALAQDVERGIWAARTIEWLALRGCDGAYADLPSALPPLDYQRPPPDSLGPQPLEWVGEMPDSFEIQITNGSRASAARIARGTSEAALDTSWDLYWSRPRGLFGTNSH